MSQEKEEEEEEEEEEELISLFLSFMLEVVRSRKREEIYVWYFRLVSLLISSAFLHA